jgi:hypothetical protein
MLRQLLRRSWVRWLVLPLLVLAAAHALWTLALKWEFERRLAELRASGAPVDLGDLRRPRIPDEVNAAALWEEAHQWYQDHLHVIPAVLLIPETVWDEDDRTAVAEYLAGGDRYIDLLGRVAAKPGMWLDLEWEAGPHMPVTVISQMNDAATYIEQRVRHAERATPEVLRQLSILLDLAPKLERSILIFVLVRWAVEDGAAEALRMLAGKPAFDAREARALLDQRFASADDPGVLREAFRGERVQGLCIVRRWIGGDSPIRIAEALAGSAPERTEWTLADHISASWPARPLAYRDGLRLLDLMERKLSLVDRPAREALPAARELAGEYSDGSPWNLFSRIFGDLAAQASKSRLHHEANMRIARVGLALLELRQTTGAWPGTLDAVVPLVGAEWIEDPYTGKPLEYEPGVRLEAAVPIPNEDFRADDEIVWRFGP